MATSGNFIIFVACAVQVDSAWLRGDRDEAHRCSRQARLWNIVGMVAGVVTYVVAVVLSVGVNVALTASG